MKIIAEITIIPIGVGVSLSKYVAKTHQILQDTGLDIELHSNGTNIQGDYDTVMQAIKKCHEILHNDMKVPRISTLIKIGSRKDKEKIMTDKVESVKKHLR